MQVVQLLEENVRSSNYKIPISIYFISYMLLKYFSVHQITTIILSSLYSTTSLILITRGSGQPKARLEMFYCNLISKLAPFF